MSSWPTFHFIHGHFIDMQDIFSHFLYMKESCDTNECVMSHVNSYLQAFALRWTQAPPFISYIVISYIVRTSSHFLYMKESCDTHECVMSHTHSYLQVFALRWTHVQPFISYIVISYIRRTSSRLLYMKESCDNECVMSHTNECVCVCVHVTHTFVPANECVV